MKTARKSKPTPVGEPDRRESAPRVLGTIVIHPQQETLVLKLTVLEDRHVRPERVIREWRIGGRRAVVAHLAPEPDTSPKLKLHCPT